MRHVDDGSLHAYLDGAYEHVEMPGGVEALERHVAGCAACDARLRAEREVHARAAGILGLASPGAAELPPFRALEERTRDGAARRRRRRLPIAWAATVVLALGAGWMAREVRQGPAGAGSGALAVAGEEAGVRDRGAVRGAGDTDHGRAADPPVGESASAMPGALAATDVGGSGAAGADPRTDEVQVREMAGRSAARSAPSVESAARPQVASADAGRTGGIEPSVARSGSQTAAAVPAGEPAEGVAPLSVRNERAAADRRMAISDVAAERESRAQLRVRPAPEPVPERADPAPLGVPVPTGRASDAPPSPTAAAPPPPPPVRAEQQALGAVAFEALELTQQEWHPADRLTAERELGRTLLSISRLPIIDLGVGAADDGTAVRVRQRLEDGGTLTLVFRRETAGEVGAASAAEPEPRGGRYYDELQAIEEGGVSRIRLRHGSLIVEAIAPVPLRRLRELIAELR